jgi:hypothetical protein
MDKTSFLEELSCDSGFRRSERNDYQVLLHLHIDFWMIRQQETPFETQAKQTDELSSTPLETAPYLCIGMYSW